MSDTDRNAAFGDLFKVLGVQSDTPTPEAAPAKPPVKYPNVLSNLSIPSRSWSKKVNTMDPTKTTVTSLGINNAVREWFALTKALTGLSYSRLLTLMTDHAGACEGWKAMVDEIAADEGDVLRASRVLNAAVTRVQHRLTHLRSVERAIVGEQTARQRELATLLEIRKDKRKQINRIRGRMRAEGRLGSATAEYEAALERVKDTATHAASRAAERAQKRRERVAAAALRLAQRNAESGPTERPEGEKE